MSFFSLQSKTINQSLDDIVKEKEQLRQREQEKEKCKDQVQQKDSYYINNNAFDKESQFKNFQKSFEEIIKHNEQNQLQVNGLYQISDFINNNSAEQIKNIKQIIFGSSFIQFYDSDFEKLQNFLAVFKNLKVFWFSCKVADYGKGEEYHASEKLILIVEKIIQQIEVNCKEEERTKNSAIYMNFSLENYTQLWSEKAEYLKQEIDSLNNKYQKKFNLFNLKWQISNMYML